MCSVHCVDCCTCNKTSLAGQCSDCLVCVAASFVLMGGRLFSPIYVHRIYVAAKVCVCVAVYEMKMEGL